MDLAGAAYDDGLAATDVEEALVEPPPGVPRWNGPYLKKKESIVDPWGHVYVYRAPGQHGEYDLYTLGSDNAEGGNGEAADVTSW